MRPFTTLVTFDRALEIVLDAAEPIERLEPVPLDQADGRVLGRAVNASADVPAFDRAAMDGYAVVAADTVGASIERPRVLTCVGSLVTGALSTRTIGAGECLEIPTGAPMPPGADAVVIVEQTDRAGDSVQVRAAVAEGQHIGRRGADVRAGEIVLPAGEVLTPGHIGAAAAVGCATLDVVVRPTVVVLSTGGEIVEPGRALAAGQVHDINRYTVSAVVRRHGGVAIPQAAASDDVDALATALDGARDRDAIVLSGGSSVGPRDLTIDALHAAGGQVLFHGIAIKPGKPTLFGRLGRTLVFGLPGYPSSCLTNAYLLLVPALRRLGRLPAWRPEIVEVPLARRITSTSERRQFYTVRLRGGRAEPAFKSSGDITSMAHADGFIDIPVECEALDAGTMVQVVKF